MIDSKTRLYGLLGDPVEHSLSPVLQNWMLEKFNINARYIAFQVSSSRLSKALDGMRGLGVAGLNVTVPHKESVLQAVDFQSTEVDLLGAANTLKNITGALSAYVTDPFGFIESLGNKKENFVNKNIALFGAGGSAKSIAYSLGKMNINRLVITNRNPDRATKLAEMVRDHFNIADVKPVSLSDSQLSRFIAESDIIINATSVGMYPDVEESPILDFSCIHSRHFVYDLIYNPGTTRLLKEAQKRGAEIQNGLDMLIFQGLESLRIWENQDLQIDTDSLNEIKTILIDELGKRFN